MKIHIFVILEFDLAHHEHLLKKNKKNTRWSPLDFNNATQVKMNNNFVWASCTIRACLLNCSGKNQITTGSKRLFS